MKPIIIGIAGGSASGKTSIAKIIQDTYKDTNSVVIIRQDDYYKDQSSKTMQERVKTNYDHPLAFDNDFLIEQLKMLLDRKTINKPVYDFVNHTRSNITEVIEPCDVIILEGLFVLEDENIRKMLDIKVYVDTDADIRFIRRLTRDVEERGRTIHSVIEQYTKTVKIMHETFVEPSKKYADLVVPEGKSNTVAIDLLCTKIGSIINYHVL